MNLGRRKFLAALMCCSAGFPVLGSPQISNVTASLAQQRNRYALLYFVQQGCQYCARETPILADFQRQTGWYIKQVDIQAQPEVRTKFNISNTPSIVLIKDDMDSRSWQPVSYGFSPADTLLNSIYGITRVLNGDASPQLLNSLLIQGKSTPFTGAQ